MDIPSRHWILSHRKWLLAVLGVGAVFPHPQTPHVSRPCSLTEAMPTSVESGVGPSLCGVVSGMAQGVGFDIKDAGSDASGSRSRKGDEAMIGYEAMQL